MRAANLVRAANLARQQLPTSGVASFALILSDPRLAHTDPRFPMAVSAALARLRVDPRVTGIRTPYTVPPAAAAGEG